MQHCFYSDVRVVADKITDCVQHHEPFLFAFDFELTEALFVEQPLAQQDILFRTPRGNNVSLRTKNKKAIRPHLDYRIEPIESYKTKFDTVLKGLRRGDSFLTNLTTKTPIDTGLPLQEIFSIADAPYCLYVPNRFVCFSPERFVHITANGTISTDPMKGTISTRIPDAEQVILADIKESAEHATIVDLLRNDLSMHADHVHVERYRYITSIPKDDDTILQVSSEIKGVLRQDSKKCIGDVLLDMLPAGSVSGAPKRATLSIIQAAEGESRGFYSGIFGYYDGEVLDSAVIIRYIEEDSWGQQYFRSGGGITAKSNLENEYNEVMQKIYIPVQKTQFSEVICVKNGMFQRLEYHLKRMSRTCQAFYGRDIEIGDSLEIPSYATIGLYKCRIVYDNHVRSVEFTEYRTKQVKSVVLAYDDTICYDYKYLDRSSLSRLVEESGTDDVIIVKEGFLTDSSFCNIVLEDHKGGLFTPKEALLKGTYRQWLLDQNRVGERSIRPQDLSQYKSIYFINAMRSLEDCTKIEIQKLCRN